MIFQLSKIKSGFQKRIQAMSANFGKTVCYSPSFVDTWCVNLEHSIISNSTVKGNIVFGPIASRRLGYSLGINTMSEKACTYNCLYCQVGRTAHCSIKRKPFLSPNEMFKHVKNKIKLLIEQNVPIDYISIVPNGEPTLDVNLSKEIMLLRELGYKVAIFTNSSLLWNDDVKKSLSMADYVSVKVDTVNESTWIRLDRPHGKLRFEAILNAIIEFSKSYQGVLSTETMLVKNINDNLDEVKELSGYLRNMKRSKSYFAVPVRPPVESYASAPDVRTLYEISGFVKNNIADSEMLCTSEGTDFQGAGNIEEELLGIMSVHPMTEEAIEIFVTNKGGSPETLKRMIDKKLITQVDYDGKIFYRNVHLVSLE